MSCRLTFFEHADVTVRTAEHGWVCIGLEAGIRTPCCPFSSRPSVASSCLSKAMAASGTHVLPQMPDFSSNDPFSTSGYMKLHLQGLLDSKEKQLQQAGSFGQRVLAQQMELEERIRQIQELDTDKGEDQEVDNEARERYRELADTLLAWDEENAQLSDAFGNSAKVRNLTPIPLHKTCVLIVNLGLFKWERSFAYHPLCRPS